MARTAEQHTGSLLFLESQELVWRLVVQTVQGRLQMTHTVFHAVGQGLRSPRSSEKGTSSQGDDAVRKYRKEIFPRVVKAFSDMSHGQLTLDVTVIPEVVRSARGARGLQAFPPRQVVHKYQALGLWGVNAF